MKKLGLIFVVIFLNSCVSLSSRDTITLRPSTDENPAVEKIHYEDFIASSQNLATDFTSDDIYATNYLQAIDLLKNVDLKNAEKLLYDISENSSDTSLVRRSKDLLSSLAVFQGNWSDVKKNKNNLMMAEAWGSAPQEQWYYPENAVTLPLEKSKSGTPLVEVKINGKKYKFWIDTGASMSVLRSDIAKKCGVNFLNSEDIGIGTATKDITFAPGIIQNMEVGGISIKNHPTIILNKSNLTFKIFKLFTILKIDGILGENAIRKMHLKMDFKNNEITLSKPQKRIAGDKNLIWITEPIVLLKTMDGRQVNFFFDSGANASSLLSNFLSKQKMGKGKTNRGVRGGAGGKEVYKNTKYTNVSLLLDDYKMTFSEISCETEEYDPDEIFIRDGVLGCDFFQDKVIEIDYTNGRLDIK